ncbi:Regulator of G-protein signaling 7 [Borealophlyctis nickersoniae]|nr:Regulator of G-protein signaling 7 [Borealophlyctis nickersoniae]
MKIQDPVRGIEIKDRKRLFQMYPATIVASDLVDWLHKNCNLFSRDEAIRMGAALYEEGYIVAVDLDQKFDSDGSLYCIQTPLLWPWQGWMPSDSDYAVFLLKRFLRESNKYFLKAWEDDRLRILQDTLLPQWQDILAVAKGHLKYEKTMEKLDARLFHIQEWGFWRVARPENMATLKLRQELQSTNKHLRMTLEQFEKNLTSQQLLAYLERQLDYLSSSLNMSRLKTSQAAKSIVTRCELFRPLDPLVERALHSRNPFISDSTELWKEQRTDPTPAEVRVWTYSIEDMLRDPLGVKYFYDFLRSEYSQENLEFYLACQSLDSIPTRQEFVKQATSIYEDFIKIGGPHELNVNSATRNAVISQFEAAKDAPHLLSYDCFLPAVQHVFTLMAKDSYVRFCNSDRVMEMTLRGVFMGGSISSASSQGLTSSTSYQSLEGKDRVGTKSVTGLRTSKEFLPTSRSQGF